MGSAAPRVSVIIPTYNRADYLPQALHSAAGQSMSPWEMIVVDDGSTDNTAEIVRTFDPKVCYVQQQHRGVAAARNTGLDAARGDVIGWLDADDLWEPEFLSTVVAVLESDAAVDGVYTGLLRIDAGGRVLPQASQTVVPASALYNALIEDCFLQTSSFVVRRKCFDLVGGFDPFFPICEDYDMFLRLAQCYTIIGIPKPLIRYRLHGQNTVANTEAWCRFRLALTEKHFGAAVGDPRAWSSLKRRAHGCAYRAAARKCIEGGQPDRGWQYLHRAFHYWPDLLRRMDTFYELALGDQPTGYRGQAETLDIEKNAGEMLVRLRALFAAAEAPVRAMQQHGYGNAYLALAILSDQGGQWGKARRYLFRAVRTDPRVLFSYSVARRFVKLYAGQRLVGLVRRMSQEFSQPTGIDRR